MVGCTHFHNAGELIMLLEEILRRLQEPVPEKAIKYKSVGGNSIAYIPWYSYCKLLDTRVVWGIGVGQ